MVEAGVAVRRPSAGLTVAVPPKRLRIAVLNRIFKPTGGGAERYSIALVEQLAERHDIHVFAQQIEHQWPGVTYHPVPWPFDKPRWINQLWFALATWWQTRRGFDVVHSHENTWHGQVQTVHVVPVKHSLLQGRTGWRLVLRWLKIATSPRLLTYLGLEHFRYKPKADRCVVLASDSLKPVMATAFPASVPSLQVVTPGVSSVAGVVDSDHKAAARVKLGLPAKGRCILFVGNDYRKKGLETLLAALPQLPADCCVAVVGNAAQIAAFHSVVDANGIRGRVFFLGALGTVDDAYQAADCLAHPTLEDTFAMVVLEAMAHGLPVVVSSAQYCGISGLLVHETNALIVNQPRDATALAQALHRLLTDVAMANKLSGNGLRFAQQHLWSEQALRQETIYQAVASGR
jgi:glycosyltransferase involved in cell wall biosynthesis